MTLKRAVFSVLASVLMVSVAHADNYPTKPIRMVIPSTPGGGTDFVGRLMGSKLAERNGWTVVPENRPGAGTALGLAEAARSPGKGYDLVIGQTDNVTLIPLLMSVTYDPIKDLVPIALVGTVPIVLVVSASSPWTSLPEVITAAKEKPGEISYGTSGVGGSIHMAIELLQQTAGVTMQHIPYKGAPLALADLVGGHLEFGGASISGASGLINSGKLRALAVTSNKRNPALPDVPTVAELGYDDYDTAIYYGVFAPSNTPEQIVNRLNKDFNQILGFPDVQAALGANGFAIDPLSPEEFASLVKSDIERAKEVIDNAGIKLE